MAKLRQKAAAGRMPRGGRGEAASGPAGGGPAGGGGESRWPARRQGLMRTNIAREPLSWSRRSL
jgi:hypothetical protein